MNKKIIIVEGYLASGKSTFALHLSKAAGVPCFIKDTFKIALCKSIDVADRAENSRFSTVAFDAMMYVTERMMESGYPFILEGNFVPAGVKKADESMVIKQFIHKYGYAALTFKFRGNTRVLHQRFVEREKSPDRGKVNTLGFEPSYEDFDGWCHNLDNFHAGGEMVTVDTTDFSAVDFESYSALGKEFIKGTP